MFETAIMSPLGDLYTARLSVASDVVNWNCPVADLETVPEVEPNATLPEQSSPLLPADIRVCVTQGVTVNVLAAPSMTTIEKLLYHLPGVVVPPERDVERLIAP